MAIVFKGVKIERGYDGKLRGDLSVQGEYGRIYLNLTEALCSKILAVCADNIVEAARETAAEFRMEAEQIEGASARKIGGAS